MIALGDFEKIRPPYEILQEECLDWLARAHTLAEAATVGKELGDTEMVHFGAAMKELIARVGCKPERIQKRGSMRPLEEVPIQGIDERMELFDRYATEVFLQFYPEASEAPDDLIHVSCTGYVAPSGAQKVVSCRGWGEKTTVTHAYHMGCYASIPAIRIAQGFYFSGKSRIDLVHTEISSLHANPFLHRPDQLVSQTLFADGFIKYTVRKSFFSPHFCVRALHEELIPGSLEAMMWRVASQGFLMSLAKEIPVLIQSALRGYLMRLFEKAGLSFQELLPSLYFAVHPGGPKILQYVQKLLGLEEWQLEESVDVMQNYGNMSSATLPHIWQQILKNEKIKNGAIVVSLAFGPGLTICGGVLEKCGG